MTEGPVNLNRVRKARARAEARRQADLNAAKFGLSKAERLAEALRQRKAREMLDRHRMEGE
jgi:hypothetical protein